MGYVGSEEFIRLQFEEYLLALISSVKCHNFLTHHANNPRMTLPHVEGDPSHDFGVDWVEAWTRSENYRIWNRFTDSHLFDVVEPKHPCAGGLTIDDVQRRIAEQVKEFHLDERFAVGKEVLGRNLQAGKEKASTVFNKLYADMEALRESQKRKQEDRDRNGAPSPGVMDGSGQTVQSVGSKAGAYLGSWGAWVGEKRKTGWGRSSPQPPWVAKKEKENASILVRSSPVMPATMDRERPKSYNESLFDAEVADEPTPVSVALMEPEHQNEAPMVPADTSVATPIADESHPRNPSKIEESDSSSGGFVEVPMSEETKAWEEDAKPKVDLEARSSAVAEAVEAATASTTIS
jgi:hypothetical protein